MMMMMEKKKRNRKRRRSKRRGGKENDERGNTRKREVNFQSNINFFETDQSRQEINAKKNERLLERNIENSIAGVNWRLIKNYHNQFSASEVSEEEKALILEPVKRQSEEVLAKQFERYY